MSASWFFGVNILDLDLGIQIDSIKQPIKSNSVGSGNVSPCGTSTFGNHLEILSHGSPACGCTMIWAIYVVQDVPIHLDTLDFGILRCPGVFSMFT